jgi:hypothetical protein
MLMNVAFFLAAGQSAEPVCGGGVGIRDCRSADGGSYVERRLGPRVVRKGTTADGASWTEYVSPAPAGWTLVGSDSAGLSWYQSCNVAVGIRGTDRFGRAVFVAPSATRSCSY